MLTSAAVDGNINNTSADSATFKITDTKLYVPFVTLSAEDNVKLSKLLGEAIIMISQLMTQLNNTMKSEKHQQEKVMILRLVVYWIFLILKKNTD